MKAACWRKLSSNPPPALTSRLRSCLARSQPEEGSTRITFGVNKTNQNCFVSSIDCSDERPRDADWTTQDMLSYKWPLP